MNYERSCGAVVFTRQHGQIQYVIIQSLEGVYGFPKGHMEGTESEVETALREIYEETGLRPSLIEGFKTTNIYPLPRKNDVIKHVTYFLAEYEDQQIKYQTEELLGADLMTFEEAMKVIQFENSKRILTEAHTFLSKSE